MANELRDSRFLVSCIFILIFFFRFDCHAMEGIERRSSEQMSSVINIGVIRNLSSPFCAMINLCIEMAVSDFYSENRAYTTRLVLHPKDVDDVLDVDLAVLELLEQEKVHGVLEPQGPTDEIFVAELGRKAQVPIISFASRGSSLSDAENPFFVRISVDDAVQARALAAICQGFGWNQVVILYEDTICGYQFLSHLNKALRDVEIELAHLTAIPASANENHLCRELKLLKETQMIKVFLVHMNASLGFKLFTVAEKLGMMTEGHAWIITDTLSNFLNSVDAATRGSMEGVLGIRPCAPFSKELQNFQEKWKRNYIMDLNVHGLWAYDMVTALANAVENIGPVKFNSLYEKSTKNTNLRISSFGPRLQRELSSARLSGLSGAFELVDGKMRPSSFEIFNVIGSGEKRLGFWTPDRGIIRELISSSTHSSSIKELRNVIWPGDSIKRPKGWSISPSGMLRVGVPCVSGSPEFVNISAIIDSVTNEANATGFAVDIFLAAMDRLPSHIDHRFYCFGDINNSYDDMLQAIPEKFDMVVADVTIWAPRTLYVDFSLPYLESGIVLVVRKRPLDMWIFTKPLRWDLWLAILVSCIFMGIVIRILESRETNAAAGEEAATSNTRISMSYLAPVAVLAFQERNMVSNKCSIFVLVCWMFMAFILMQSFQANLSAILTVDQLKFAFSEDYRVGYRSCSFTRNFLRRNLNIDGSRLGGYSTNQEFHDAMSKGSKNGGIDAIFDEIPYMKLFLNQHKSRYKIVGPTYRADGLGFAFSVGSPLAATFSRALLNLTDDEQREYYEAKNFGPDYSSLTVSEGISRLTLNDFSGLFIIVASAAVFSVICSESAILCKLNSIKRQLLKKCVRSMNKKDDNVNVDDNTANLEEDTDDEPQNREQEPEQDRDHEEIVEEAQSNLADAVDANVGD